MKILSLFPSLLFWGPLLPAVPVAHSVAVNDVCTGAEPLIVGVKTNGNFSEATLDTNVAEDCIVSGRGPEFPGLWYSFVGTGRSASLFSCDDPDMRISVFRGGDCNSLRCVAGVVHPCFDDLVFFSLRGETYYILQQSDLPDNQARLTARGVSCGFFGLSLFCPFAFQGVIGRFIRGVFGALGF